MAVKAEKPLPLHAVPPPGQQHLLMKSVELLPSAAKASRTALKLSFKFSRNLEPLLPNGFGF